MNKELKIAIQAVKKASKIILKYYKNQSYSIETKDDNSPVTQADKESEKIIINHLKKHFPAYGFFTEEHGDQIKNCKNYWVIDPIDGTKNFIRQIPYFSILLALVKNNKVVLGISYNPVSKDMLYSLKSKGTFLNKHKLQVSNVKKLSDAWINHGGINYFIDKGYLKNLVKVANKCARIRGFGNYWMCQLFMQGKFDVVLGAKIKFWDIAAFKLMVEEAGGKVTDFNGNEININSGNIIATNKLLHKQVLKLFSKT